MFVCEVQRVEVTGAKNIKKIPIPAMQTSIGNNSGCIKHRAMKFACSMRFSAMADRMVCNVVWCCSTG